MVGRSLHREGNAHHRLTPKIGYAKVAAGQSGVARIELVTAYWSNVNPLRQCSGAHAGYRSVGFRTGKLSRSGRERSALGKPDREDWWNEAEVRMPV